MTNKRKWTLVAAAVLALVVLAGAVCVSCSRTTALEQLSGADWSGEYAVLDTEAALANFFLDVDNQYRDTVMVLGRDLKDILSGVKLWRIPSPNPEKMGMPALCFQVVIDSVEKHVCLYEGGYIHMSWRTTEQTTEDPADFWRMSGGPVAEGEEVISQREDIAHVYYRDDGSLYRQVKELIERTK